MSLQYPSPMPVTAGHNCIDHNFLGHSYLGHSYLGHNYIYAPATQSYACHNRLLRQGCDGPVVLRSLHPFASRLDMPQTSVWARLSWGCLGCRSETSCRGVPIYECRHVCTRACRHAAGDADAKALFFRLRATGRCGGPAASRSSGTRTSREESAPINSPY